MKENMHSKDLKFRTSEEQEHAAQEHLLHGTINLMEYSRSQEALIVLEIINSYWISSNI